MKKLYLNYVEAFKGLSTEIWYLSLIGLVNRAGTMVIPFLSLYLKKDLGFSEVDIGSIFACFGIGSVIGSWLGGKLTDSFGFYKRASCVRRSGIRCVHTYVVVLLACLA